MTISCSSEKRRTDQFPALLRGGVLPRDHFAVKLKVREAKNRSIPYALLREVCVDV